ncbi:MAG TPA: hypothetical protein VIG33_14770 [Pseudobdellovibrionaceae bacterium]|jgi:hypothetical protein
MDSEFKKRMQLLDPNYVAPDSERVKNRKPIDIKTEAPRKNEAGLEYVPDTPVDSHLQQLYIDRMMDKDSVDKLDLIPEDPTEMMEENPNTKLKPDLAALNKKRKK